MQEPKIEKNNTRLLWILPIIALGIGLYLAYNHLSNLGASVDIEFDNAQGIEAGKTKIRFKSLEIGTITNITLTDDFKKVIAHAQMTRTATPLLKQDTQFWVVKPQISASGITGLDTIISGSFIAIAPGESRENRRHFIGLNSPPLIPASEPGVRVHLITNNVKGLNIGSPVYYRGFKVGQIDQIQFDDHFDRIKLEAFINSPYDKLINPNTKFWNISGFNFKLGANGADFSMESLETLALGGITFSTPMSLSAGGKDSINENTIFTLYANEQDTNQSPIFEKQYYVLYFDSSIRGLNTGAPVEFDGIDIGEVIDIRLLYDEKQEKAIIPVLIELEPERIARVNLPQDSDNQDDIMTTLIQQGMQASIETGSLLTGEKFIRLSMYPDDKQNITKDKYSSYTVLPTRNTGINKITDDIGSIVSTVKNLPFESLFNKAQTLMDKAGNAAGSLDKIIATKEIQNIGKTIDKSLKQLDGTLASVRTTSDSANIVLKNLNNQLKTVTMQLENTLSGLAPNSNLYYNLNQTLQNLQKTSISIDRLMKKLDAKPNALIFGE
ncbi:intermembrane transport protein PqiB [Suttonella ornithocola]|uniref:Paraquat-inducible protein B n=1 Tax=Suttonella ornithocola TaxID=279832 RepID=A0A380N257_9GAMM|nr:MlaD family protein [Suttonella ornithocola]SUO97857.1 paraquat-inducible protein B [Suttonella ornithocola]